MSRALLFLSEAHNLVVQLLFLFKVLNLAFHLKLVPVVNHDLYPANGIVLLDRCFGHALATLKHCGSAHTHRHRRQFHDLRADLRLIN